jgi:hypothetical protein
MIPQWFMAPWPIPSGANLQRPSHLYQSFPHFYSLVTFPTACDSWPSSTPSICLLLFLPTLCYVACIACARYIFSRLTRSTSPSLSARRLGGKVILAGSAEAQNSNTGAWEGMQKLSPRQAQDQDQSIQFHLVLLLRFFS